MSIINSEQLSELVNNIKKIDFYGQIYNVQLINKESENYIFINTNNNTHKISIQVNQENSILSYDFSQNLLTLRSKKK
jgi:hypothetical protein